MILVNNIIDMNANGYEYDIHSLVKAFYPQNDIHINSLVYNEIVNVISSKGEINNYISEKNEYQVIFEMINEDLRLIINEYYRQASITLILINYMVIAISQYTIEYEVVGLVNDEEKSEITKDLGVPRSNYRNIIKRTIYRLLSNKLKRRLPWGTLTGIRPIKLAMKYIEQNVQNEVIFSKLEEEYYVSPEKIRLSIDIAKREKKILDRMKGHDGYSLYVGIPFCPDICSYCSFSSVPIKSAQELVEPYIRTLLYELEYVATHFANKTLETIYIGGGTPTSINAEQLNIILGTISELFNTDELLEYTLEAGRPDSITLDKLKVIKGYNINRISINPQTMNQITLDKIGRTHTVIDVLDTYAMARNMGFDNINMDIILGLPQEGYKEVQATLGAISKLKPDSLTVHALAIKRGSRIYEELLDRNSDIISENVIVQEDISDSILTSRINAENERTYELIIDSAASMQLYPYYLYRQKNIWGNLENIGYAKSSKYGIYNIAMMEETQSIVAVGAGAVTKRVDPILGIARCDNVKDVREYIDRIDEMLERKMKLFGI